MTQDPAPPVDKYPGMSSADSRGDVFWQESHNFPTNKLVILFPLQTLPHNCSEEFVGEEVCSLKSSWLSHQ